MTATLPLLLLIEDDPLVRGSLAGMLARNLRVISVASAEEALEQLLLYPDVDAIVSDVTMPGMGPLGLFSRLPPRLRRRMGLITGGIADPTVRDAVDALALPLLFKPFSRAALVDLVSVLLCALDEDEPEPDLFSDADDSLTQAIPLSAGV